MNYGKTLFTILAVILLAAGGFFAWRYFLVESPDPPIVVTTAAPTSSDGASEASTTETTTGGAALLEEQKNALIERIGAGDFHPNELGEIMVLMYHRIVDEDSEYDRSAESFRNDLKILYEKGFRSISMSDYINSSIDIPEGTTPVVFTFDDGDITNFKAARDESGNLIPDPDSAVGIIEAFYREHPDFGKNAIFYLNAEAFGEPEYLEWKLRYLIENGFEIGNHTYGHEFLNQLDADEIQEAIGRNLRYYRNIYDGVNMDSMALPYGIAPVSELEEYAVRGVYSDTRYENKVLLLVGWRPTWPLYAKGLSPTGVNRVRCGDGEFEMKWWLDVYEETPELRYISDGVPGVITVPEAELEYINGDMIEAERVLSY